MDINHILTVLTAPDDCKELIRALAAEARHQRGRNREIVRELECVQMALDSMTNAHDMLMEDAVDQEALRVERDAALERLAALEGAVKRQAKAAPPGPGSSLDDLLRYAAAAQTEVRVTFAAATNHFHQGTLEGVPVWDSNGPLDRQPWHVADWYCGTDAEPTDSLIIAVELL